jgi:hypothetical protein
VSSNNVIELSKLLAKKNLIAPGVTISANLKVRGFGGVLMNSVKRGVVTSVDEEGVRAMFENRQHRHAKFEELRDIEGMDIARYAQAYKVKPGPKRKK